MVAAVAKPKKLKAAKPLSMELDGKSEVHKPTNKVKRRIQAEPSVAEGKEPQNKKQRTKDAKDEAGSAKGEAAGTASVTDFSGISDATRKVLEARGITSLFEIQQKAFRPCFEGKDVVGRAKTGCGKTLAFVLPTVERICAQGLVAEKAGRRLPVAVAVAPTRELARQIFSDFESVGSASSLCARCFYGGTAFGPQCEDIRAGVDILVCTPGRLLDHIRRQTVDLSRCRVLVLDEADEMLSMGFQEDVESILQALPQEGLQTLLFSATLPKWVNTLVEKHLKEPAWIDVASGGDSNATNSKITHKCISCPPSFRGDCIGDLCKVHAGAFGKTLVFTDTKKECDELGANEKLAAIGAGVLHGDISQFQRDAVMDAFRSGRIKCLVATDVAARGLDVPSVDLVIQTHPSSDLDKYVHRAGRTARGGREGTCVTFYSNREEYIIRLLEHKKGIRMQRIGPPQPEDVVRAAAADAVTQLDLVHQDSMDAFLERAKELIADRGAEVSLAAALAAMTGHSRRLRGRSVLSAFEGNTAVQLHTERGLETNSKGWYLLRQMLPQDVHEACKGLTLCNDGYSAIFDVPDDMVPRLMQASLWRGCTFSVPKLLPEMKNRECDLGEAAQQLKDRKQRWWQGIQERKGREKNEAGAWGSSGSGGRGGRGSGGGAGRGRGRGGAEGGMGRGGRGGWGA